MEEVAITIVDSQSFRRVLVFCEPTLIDVLRAGKQTIKEYFTI